MFEHFNMSMQQDVKLFLVFPILCAVFRSVFIAVYNPYPTLANRKKSLWTCFRYGFWWGMDFNAYMFLIPLILVSLPAAFLSFFSEYGDVLRVAIGLVYAIILYAAFMGKMIFYRHFHDTYNYLIHMGKHAEKHNLIDVFFNREFRHPHRACRNREIVEDQHEISVCVEIEILLRVDPSKILREVCEGLICGHLRFHLPQHLIGQH